MLSLSFLLLRGHEDHKAHHPIAIPILVILGNEFDKVIIEGSASLNIKSRRVCVSVTVARVNLVLGITQNAH